MKWVKEERNKRERERDRETERQADTHRHTDRARDREGGGKSKERHRELYNHDWSNQEGYRENLRDIEESLLKITPVYLEKDRQAVVRTIRIMSDKKNSLKMIKTYIHLT